MRISFVVKNPRTLPAIGEVVGLVRVVEPDESRPRIEFVRRIRAPVRSYLGRSLARVTMIERRQSGLYEITVEPVDEARFRIPGKRGRRVKPAEPDQALALRRAREEAGLTGAAIARALGISRQAYSQLETGKRRLTPAMRERIAQAIAQLAEERNADGRGQ